MLRTNGDLCADRLTRFAQGAEPNAPPGILGRFLAGGQPIDEQRVMQLRLRAVRSAHGASAFAYASPVDATAVIADRDADACCVFYALKTIDVQLLSPRTSTIQARTQALQMTGVDFDDDVLSDPQRLQFWGRGLGGQYDIVIPKSEFALHSTSLEGRTEIQVWLAYQYTR